VHSVLYAVLRRRLELPAVLLCVGDREDSSRDCLLAEVYLEFFFGDFCLRGSEGNCALARARFGPGLEMGSIRLHDVLCGCVVRLTLDSEY
jgi:hypothetical protein